MPKFDSVGFVAHVAQQMRINRWKPKPQKVEQPPAPQETGLSEQEQAELISYLEETVKE